MVGEQLVTGDRSLQPGDVIRIGHSQLVFVHRLAEAFSDSSAVARGRCGRDGASRPPSAATTTTSERAGRAAARRRSRTAAARRGSSSRARRTTSGRLEDRPGRGQALPPGLRAGQGPDVGQHGRAGPGRPGRGDAHRRRRPCCCLPHGYQGEPPGRGPGGGRLAELVGRSHYHRVSHVLAATVMREGEAVLARNVHGRQHPGQPRQPGRDPRHQRDLRARSAAAARSWG